MGTLEGQFALVTGASRGIGRAIADAYAGEGATVFLAARSVSDLDDAASRISAAGGTAVAVEMDVTNAESVESAYAAIGAITDRLDIAVLNAGASPTPASVAKSTDEQWESTFEVNVFGLVRTARAAVPFLKANGGKIIVMGSGTGHQTNPGLGAYSASKAAVASVTRSLALELRRHKIAVNEFVPGPVITDLNPVAGDGIKMFEEMGEWLKQPEDVAQLALFLATSPNNGPSGQTFSLMGRLL